MNDQITLTAYTDQVRDLVRNDRNDEALAICKHILQYYPKCVDAYQQMGQALLEKGELDDAKDMFRRVLSADPENITAYIGLADIFEKEHLIAEAVWHMERAFELSPGNPELQKELLRLYHETDNRPRNRMKLTSGALARLYTQEGLFAQAAQEWRVIVAGQPTRYDARIALAETLWRMGRLSESAQIAEQLLDPLPFCLKANLILGTAWKETGLAESERYLQRAQAIEPTNQTAQRLFGLRSPLAPQTIRVPRYTESAPREMPSAVKPAPSPSLTDFLAAQAEVEIEAEAPSETTLAPDTAPPESATPAESQSRPTIVDAALPPWLRSTFQAPTQVEPEPPAELSAPEATSLPTWLSQIPPATAPTETFAPTTEEPAATLPAWMREETPTETPAPTTEESAATLSAWLREETPTETPVPATEESAATLSAWLREETPTETPAPTTEESAATLPAWMRGETPTETSAPTTEESAATLSAWLREETPTETSAPAAEEPAATLPAWVRGETQSETSAPTAEEPAATLPAWVREDTQSETSAPAAEEPAATLPAWVREETQPETSAPAAEEPAETLPAWMREETQSETSAPAAEKSAELPDWLNQITRTEEIASEPTPALPVEELPEWLQEPITPATTKPQWVRDLQVASETVAQVAPAHEPASVPTPETPSIVQVSPPQWVRDLQSASETVAQVAPAHEPPTPETPSIVAMPVAMPEPAPAPARPKRKRASKGYARLTQARIYRDANQMNDALAEYDWVVQHAPRLVAEVIEDLEVLMKRIDMPLEVHRVLGDAYTRAHRLADALERYRFVLEHVS